MYALLLLTAYLLAFVSVPSVLINRIGRPQVAVAWVLALFVLPFIGPAAWWWVGRVQVARRRKRRKQARVEFKSLTPAPVANPSSSAFTGLVPVDVPTSASNRVVLMVDGPSAFPQIESAIGQAAHSIRVEMYIWEADESGRRMVALLANRAKAGVAVHILVDGVGARHFDQTFGPILRQAGAKVATFEPVRFAVPVGRLNLRNHRKVILLDGVLAFTGGMNVGDAYAVHWHDLAMSIRGPAIGHLDEVFREDWYYAARQTLAPVDVPPGAGDVDCAVLATGPDGGTVLEDTLFQLLTGAKHRILLTTPYFLPTPTLLAALRGAAMRGVDVRLLTPRHTDWPLIRTASRALFPALLAVGVRVFEYQTKPLHLKALVIDDHLCLMGSPNFDMRSFNLNFEVSCLIADRAIAGQLASLFASDLEHSDEVYRGHLARAPWLERTIGVLAQLLSPIL